MYLKDAQFLDYTPYNQDQYAKNVSRYQDSYIVSGLDMKNDTTMEPGELFLKGWHLTFYDNFSCNPVQGNWIYVTYTSTLGSADVGLYESIYTRGTLDALVSQGSSLPSNAYPLYRYLSGQWVLQSNGRIDKINNKKAGLNNALTLDGSDINVTNPVFNTATNINTALQDLENKVDTLTGGGLTEATADNKYYQRIYLNKSSITPDDISGKNMAEIINMIVLAYPTNNPCIVTGVGILNGFGSLAEALKELTSDIYGITENLFYWSFILTCPGGTTQYNAGGTELTVIANGGAYSWNFLVDNYGANFATVNTDAFRAPNLTGKGAYFTGTIESRGLRTGNGDVYFSPTGLSLELPSDFSFVTGDGGNNTLNFDTKMNFSKDITVGNAKVLANGSFITSKVGNRNIEFNNATGTSGSKSITLNHNNGAFAGSIEWNRAVNGSNSIAVTQASLTEGLLYVGIKSQENTRIYNYATGKYVQEASTYLAREVDLVTMIVNLQEKVDAQDLRIQLLETQMQALISGETPMQTLPVTLSNDTESAELTAAKQMLENSKTELANEEFNNARTRLLDQREVLRSNLVAVNVLRSVPATTLNYKNVLANVEAQLAELEANHMEGVLNESK